VRGQIETAMADITATVVLNWTWGSGGPPPAGFEPGGGMGPGPSGGGGYWRRTGPATGPSSGAGGPAVRPDTGPSVKRHEDVVGQEQKGTPGARPASGPSSGRRKSRFRALEGESELDHRARLREMQREREELLATQGFPSNSRVQYNQSVKAYNDLISLRKRLGEEGPEARLPYLRGQQGAYPERLDAGGRIVRGPAEVTIGRGKTQRVVPVGPLVSELTPKERRLARIRSGQMGPAEGVSYDVQPQAEETGVKIDPETGRVVDITEEAGAAGLRAGTVERRGRRAMKEKVLGEQEAFLASLKQERTEMEGRLQRPQSSSRYRSVMREIARVEPIVEQMRGTQGPRGQRAQRSFLTPGAVMSPEQEALAREAIGARVEPVEGLEATPEQIARAQAAIGAGASPEEVMAEVEARLREINQIVTGARQTPNEAWEKFAGGMKRGEKGRFIPKGKRAEKFLDIADRPVPLAGGEFMESPFSRANAALEAGNREEAYTIARDARTALMGAAFKGGVIPGVAAGTAKRYLDPKRLDLPTAGKPEQQEAQLIWGTQMESLEAIQTEVRRQRAADAAVARRSWGGQAAAETRAGITTGERPRDPSGKKVTDQEMIRRGRALRASGAYAYDPNRDRIEDPLVRQALELQEQRERLTGQAQQAQQRMSPKIDAELVGFLNRQRGGKGATNLERMRSLVEKIQSAPDEDVPALLKKAAVYGKPPAGFDPIIGALTSLDVGFSPKADKKRRATARKDVDELALRLSKTPEELATTYVPDPDVHRADELQREARAADIQSRWMLRRARRESRMAGEAPGEEMLAAAGGAIPPITPNTVNEGWEWVPGAGGGGPPGAGPGGGWPEGPIHVLVDNFPEWMTSQAGAAAGPYRGMEPGEQERAVRGTGEQISAEDMEEAVRQREAKSAQAKAEKDEKARSATEERERRAGVQAARPAPESPRALAARLGALGGDPALAERLTAIAERRTSATEISPIEQRRQEIEQQLAMARQGLPIRGFATSVAQEVAGGARGQTFARFSEAGRLLKEALDLEDANKRIGDNMEINSAWAEDLEKKQKSGVKLTAEQEKTLAKMPDRIKEQGKAIDENKKKQQALLLEADKMSQLTGGERLLNLGKSLVGSVGGFLAYSTAIGGVGAALGAAGLAAADYAERAGGYLQATQKITGALSDQTLASGGAVKQTVAHAAAQANLSEESYRLIAPILEQRAAVEAGNKAYQEQLKLMAAARNVAGGRREGFDQGLFQTTGGILGTPLFGTPSTQELIGQRLERIGELPIAEKMDLRTGNKADFDPLEFTEGEMERQRKFDVRAERLGETLDELNAKFQGSGLQLVDALSSTAADVGESARVLTEGGAGGIADQLAVRGVSLSKESLRTLEQGGAEAVGRALEMFNERDQRPDPAVLLAGLQERVIPALQYQIGANLANQLQLYQPARTALGYMAQPQTPLGQGLVPQTGGRFDPGAIQGLDTEQGTFAEVPQHAIDSFNRYSDVARQAIEVVNAKVREGEQVLSQMQGVDPGLIAQLQGFGTALASINEQQGNLQAEAQMIGYNRQLYIAQRTLGDLAALTGRDSDSFVGALQRQDLLLSRRSQQLAIASQQLGLQTQELQLQSAEIGNQQQLLQLERSQRQVNFQRAIAGFTAPGLTPEERAARIEEAKVEADYAQREIDFGRQQLTLAQKTLVINREQYGLQVQSASLAQQQFQNQVALQDALNERAYLDQATAIAEMQRQAQIAAEMARLNDERKKITEAQQIILDQINAQVEAFTKMEDAQVQFTTDLITQTGEAVETIVEDVAEIFNRIRALPSPFPYWARGQSAPTADTTKLNYRPGDAGKAGSTSTSGGSTGQLYSGPQAAGMLQQYSSPTRLTVGEAGTETVAILRNPRQMLLGGGSNGGGVYAPISIVVTGNKITDQADEDRLAAKVTRMVQEELSRRTSTFGLFSAR
jgi:hypothetical protein